MRMCKFCVLAAKKPRTLCVIQKQVTKVGTTVRGKGWWAEWAWRLTLKRALGGGHEFVSRSRLHLKFMHNKQPSTHTHAHPYTARDKLTHTHEWRKCVCIMSVARLLFGVARLLAA